MNYKRGVTEIGLIKAFILAIGVAFIARAGTSYLPLTGPPSLRTLVVRTPSPEVAAIKLVPPTAPIATNADNCPPVVIKSSADTNATDVEYSVSSGNPFMGGLPASGAIPMGAPPGFTMPEQDITGITPQMLTTYFQPSVLGTNGLAVPVAYRVGFVPPFAEPDKSSHAEYIIK